MNRDPSEYKKCYNESEILDVLLVFLHLRAYTDSKLLSYVVPPALITGHEWDLTIAMVNFGATGCGLFQSIFRNMRGGVAQNYENP